VTRSAVERRGVIMCACEYSNSYKKEMQQRSVLASGLYSLHWGRILNHYPDR
jgi:hypothetical protein